MQSSRGRARGRARAAATGDPPMAGGPPPGFHNQNRGGGRSPQPPTEAMGRMSMRGGGRGGMRGGSSGRGGARGAARAPTYDIIKTRPDHVAQDKRGSSGTPMTLTTNYFPLDTKGSIFFILKPYKILACFILQRFSLEPISRGHEHRRRSNLREKGRFEKAAKQNSAQHFRRNCHVDHGPSISRCGEGKDLHFDLRHG